jgi:hypothetical protein
MCSDILAGGWGQAAPTAFGSWQRGGGEGGGEEGGRRKEEGEDRTPLIKSNNPDMAGREKNPHSKTIPLPFCNAYLLVAVG